MSLSAVNPSGGGPLASARSSNAAPRHGLAGARRPPAIVLRDVSKTYGLGRDPGAGPAPRDPSDRPRRLRGDHGQLGQRQEHADEHPRLPGPADRRPLPDRRRRRPRHRRRRPRRPSQPQDRVRLPELQPRGSHERPRQRRAAARLRRRDRHDPPRSVPRTRWPRSGWPTAFTTSPPSSRAASSSASPSPARSSPTRPMILADEPTGNLDSRSTAEVLRIFASLNEEGRTVSADHPRARRRRPGQARDHARRRPRDRRPPHHRRPRPGRPRRSAQKSAHDLYGGTPR